jgi:hypothetical protein
VALARGDCWLLAALLFGTGESWPALLKWRSFCRAVLAVRR